ncbi:MAG: hypothetical protein ACXABO_02975 [Promethearchaeota archaeon]|jgi:hypothetical protein
MKDHSYDESDDESYTLDHQSDDHEIQEDNELENYFIPKDENESVYEDFSYEFEPGDEVEYRSSGRNNQNETHNNIPESAANDPTLSDFEKIQILEEQLNSLNPYSVLDHHPNQDQINKLNRFIFELQKEAGIKYNSNFEPRILNSRVFPNYNIPIGPKGSTAYDALSLINDLKAKIKNHTGRISDARMSLYLGQVDDYIRYAKKNTKRNPEFHFSHQELLEFKQNLRSHFRDISFNEIRKYKKFNNLRIGKNKVYDYNEYFVENYFKDINSLEKAYWLGFIFADGTVGYKPQIVSKDGTRYLRFRFSQIYRFGERKGNLSGEINYDGIEAVNRLAKALGIHPSKIGIDNRGAYSFEITSKVLTNQLISHGVIIGEDKTYNIRLPNLDSRELYISFLLGYFDGDGTKGTSRITSGSKGFLDDIKNHFEIPYNVLPQLSSSGGTAWNLNLGAETFNEMMDIYKHSMSIKRRYFQTSQQLKESMMKYDRPEITEEFLSELQILLFKAPEKNIADYIMEFHNFG